MINGRVFDWESIRITLAAFVNLEITNISYSSESGAESVHGRGRAPRGYGRTNLVQEASLDLPAPSFLLLSGYAVLNGGMFNIPSFTVSVSYANFDQIPQVDTLPACVITRVETEASQNDAEVAMKKLSLNVLNPIKYDGQPVI